jgi:cell division protein FtsW (lipid II flippase)
MGDDDDLTMAWFVFVVALLLYLLQPDFSQALWLA